MGCRSSATGARRSSGERPIGIQPSPKRAARRSACGGAPPIRIGGRGGRGRKRNRWPFCSTIGGEAALRSRRRVCDRTAAALVDAGGAELGFHPADAGAQQHPAAGELLDRRDPLRRRQRLAVRQDEHADAEADAIGRRGEVGERRERIEIAPVRALGVVRRYGDVIGHPEPVEPCLLRRARTSAEQIARRFGSHVAERDVELHAGIVARWAAGLQTSGEGRKSGGPAARLRPKAPDQPRITRMTGRISRMLLRRDRASLAAGAAGWSTLSKEQMPNLLPRAIRGIRSTSA